MKITFNEKEINVKDRLTFTESVEFVSRVANNVSSIEDMSYIPTVKDLYIVFGFYNMYVEGGDISEELDIEKLYHDLDLHLENIDKFKLENLQFRRLLNDIDLLIEHNNNVIVSNSKKDSLSEFIDNASELLDMAKDKLDGIDKNSIETLCGVMGKLNLMDEKEILNTIVETFRKDDKEKESKPQNFVSKEDEPKIEDILQDMFKEV